MSGAPAHRLLHPTVVRLGVRSVFGRKRGVLLYLLPVALVGLAVLVRLLVGEDQDAAQAVLRSLGLVVVVPLVALLATSGLLAPEIDDGSISYLLAKPVPRRVIVASKLVVALGCVLGCAVAPMLVAGLVLHSSAPSLAVGFAVGAAVAGTAYAALFSWMAVLSRHSVVIGLVYVLVWEGLLGGLLSGIRWVSVARWASEVVDAIAGTSLVSDLPLAYALVATVVVVAGGTYLTSRRLRGFNLTGDE